MSDAKVVDAAVDWYMARTVFLKLPAGDPDTRRLLDDLAKAEDKLSRSVREGIRDAFAPNPLDVVRYTEEATE